MIVLKIIGWIILAIIALITFVLCIKVRIIAEYSEIDTRVRVQWLFFKVPLFPSEKKNSDKKNGEQKNQQNTGSEKVAEAEQLTETVDEQTDGIQSDTSEDTNTANVQSAEEISESGETPAPKQKNNLLKTLYDAHGVDGLLLIAKRTFGYVGTYFGDLAKSLVVDELYVDVRCTKKDAASTAIYYGEVCSVLFPMLGAMVSKYKVRKYDINVYPDYLARQSSASFAISMHLYPIRLGGVSLVFGCRMLFKVLLRLIVKIFLPKKKVNAENSNTVGNKAPATEK